MSARQVKGGVNKGESYSEYESPRQPLLANGGGYSNGVAKRSTLQHDEQGIADVTKFLVDCSDAEIIRVLSEVDAGKPGILQKAMKARESAKKRPSNSPGPSPREDQKANPETVSTRITTLDMIRKEPPIVQFSSSMYYVGEQESFMIIDVMRMQPLDGESVVRWTTVDSTAVAGEHYIGKSETLIFRPGEMLKSIRISILEAVLWDTVLEFSVELQDKGSRNCQLGRYLWRTRVKMLDQHTFPSNKYADDLNSVPIEHMSKRLEEFNKLALLWEYVRLNWKHNRWVTIKCILAGQFTNCETLLLMYINVYLIDFVLNPDVDDEDILLVRDHHTGLMAIVIARIVMFLMCHASEYWAISLGLPGMGKKLLQTRLLRRFISCEDKVHVTIRASELITAMSRDAEMLVDNGYAPLVKIFTVFGKLGVILIYQVSSPVIFHKPFRPIMTVVPLFILPIIVLSFVYCRQAGTRELLKKKNAAEDAFMGYISDTLDNYGLITGYFKRDRCVADFDGKIKEMNGARKAAVLRNCNNGKFAVLVTQLLVAAWTIAGGSLVLEGKMKLGIYLTQLNIFATLGNIWMQVYLNIQDMVTCGPSMRAVTYFMNLPFDLDERMEINRMRRKAVKESKQLNKMSNTFVSYDLLHIEVRDAKVNDDLTIPGKMLIRQGEFIALLGPRGAGKTSLLRLLGGSLLPEMSSLEGNGGSSALFIPSHLRVLHIPPEPLFFLGSLYDNLTYGVAKGDPDGNIERVHSICEKLDLPPHVLTMIRKQDVVRQWQTQFSASELALLNLARAFITNPELLCVHRPTNIMDEPTSLCVMRLFSTFVEDKGLEMDPRKWHLRRPRTCVITSNKAMSAATADRTYILTKKDGLRSLTAEEVQGLRDDPQCMTESGLEACLNAIARAAENGNKQRGLFGKMAPRGKS